MAAKKKGGFELVKFEDLLPQLEDTDFDEMLENLSEMENIEYPRIRARRIPKQGFRFVMGSDEDAEAVETFEAVILYYGRQNTYWSTGFDAKNPTPPDCFSVDGKQGSKAREGKKFGDCGSCALNKFKSHPSGKGKACRNQIKLWMLRPGTLVPTTLFLPPTAIRAFTNSFLMEQVTQKGLAYWKVMTKVSIYQKDDENFFRIKFEVTGKYAGEESAQLKKTREFWLEAIQRDRQQLDGSVSESNDGGSSDSGGTTDSVARPVEPKEPVVSTVTEDDDDDVPF